MAPIRTRMTIPRIMVLFLLPRPCTQGRGSKSSLRSRRRSRPARRSLRRDGWTFPGGRSGRGASARSQHAQDFLHAGVAGFHARQRRFLEILLPLFAEAGFQLINRSAADDDVADLVVDGERLV